MRKSLILSAVLMTALILTGFFSGCDMRDGYEDCRKFIRFTYTWNMQRENQFPAYVDEVRVFFYDENNRFVGVKSETNAQLLHTPDYRMEIPYAWRGYKAVVWAGKTGDDYILPTPQLGDSPDQLILKLKEQSISDKEIATVWYNGITALDGEEVQTLDLVRMTNRIIVRLGSETYKVDDYFVRIIADNTTYDSQNNIIPQENSVTYRAWRREIDTNSLTEVLEVMKLMPGHDVRFSIINKETGIPLKIGSRTELDLVKYLLMTKPTNMSEQEYLDRQSLWDLTFHIEEYRNEPYIPGMLVVGIWELPWTKWIQFETVDF